MAVTLTATYILPTAASQDATVGTYNWAYINEILENDGLTAPAGCAFAFPSFTWHDIVRTHLVIGGVIQTAVNKAANQRVDTNPNLVLGGVADLWSASLTPAIVKASDFGVAIAYGDEDAIGTPRTKYLLGCNFPFTIPDSSTISGVQVKVDHKWFPSGGGGTATVAVDDVQMQITYSWEPICNTSGKATAEIYVPDDGQPERQKIVRYFVYDNTGSYLREWRDVENDMSLRTEVNKALYNIDLKLARNPFLKLTSTESLLDETGETIIDEQDSLVITTDVGTAVGLGPGTDAEVNNRVKIIAYWGRYESLLDESGSPILDENGFHIQTTDGAPDGLTLYSGYIQDWETEFGGTDAVSTYLMNDAEQLNNIMLEKDETALITALQDSDSIGIAGAGFNDNIALAQTFTMPSTQKVSRISFYAKAGYPNYPSTFQMSLYSGSDPNAPGTLLAQSNITILNYITLDEMSFVFPSAIQLTNATAYTVIITTDEYKTGGGSIYPVYFATSSSYSGVGTGYVSTNSETSYVDTSHDLAFIVWQAGLDTKVPFLSEDPSNIAKYVVDFARSRGADIFYDDESIEMTGTEVTYTFNANTVAEALEKVLELCPTDWYWTYDPGSNKYSLKVLADDPVRKFTNKKDVITLRIRKSIMKLINQVYFTGGGDPALFRKVTDAASRSAYRPALTKLSDSRVTDDDTAVIMSEAQIDRYKDPIYVSSVSIGKEHPDAIEDIELGEKVGFLNYGNFIDDLELQIASMTYDVDTVTLELGVILPKVTKRIEDLKRNLDVIQQEANPVSPDED